MQLTEVSHQRQLDVRWARREGVCHQGKVMRTWTSVGCLNRLTDGTLLVTITNDEALRPGAMDRSDICWLARNGCDDAIVGCRVPPRCPLEPPMNRPCD